MRLNVSNILPRNPCGNNTQKKSWSLHEHPREGAQHILPSPGQEFNSSLLTSGSMRSRGSDTQERIMTQADTTDRQTDRGDIQAQDRPNETHRTMTK